MTYSFNTTYFQITYNNTTPTDYSRLTGNQAGGLDSQTAWNIQSTVKTTGGSSVSGTPFVQGATIIINGYTVTFSSTDHLADAITKINLLTKFTGVYADQSVASGYITMQNAPGFEGQPFYLQEGNGTALATLGLNNPGYYPSGQYKNTPSVVGGSFTSVTNGMYFNMNNVTITFTAGNIQSAASQINAVTPQTGVTAEVAGPYLQLESNGFSQPIAINNGNALTNLGFSAGVYTGPIGNITLSQDKERANMRWFQVVNQLESTATPSYFGDISRVGGVGNAALNSVTWTVGYECYAAITTHATACEPDSGATFTGTAAIQRLVARGLVNTWGSNRKLFAPCVSQAGGTAWFNNPGRIQNLTAQGIDSNVQAISNNIVVTQIPGV